MYNENSLAPSTISQWTDVENCMVSHRFPLLGQEKLDAIPVEAMSQSQDRWLDVLVNGFGNLHVISPSTKIVFKNYVNWTNSDLFNLVTNSYCTIQALDETFIKESPNSVDDFLSAKSFLIRILNDFAKFMRINYSVDQILISYFNDQTYGIDSLMVKPYLGTDDLDEIIKIEDDVLDTFFYPRHHLISEYLVLSL